MANQPTKYKKFLAGAASATLVATAIVPTALAAEVEKAATDFSDVAATHTHYGAIMQAVERGLFDGYTDGTFKPENSIDRKGVVKSLAKYVVAQSSHKTFEEYITANGLSDKVTPFTDVPATHGDAELFNASLIVKDSGIFVGSNNNLMPANNITRQQMAQVLVKGFGLKDLAGVESEVTDNAKAQTQYVGYINILSENGVTEVTSFNPTGFVKRGQMASFLNRSFDAVNTVAPGVVSVSAINNTTVEVTYKEAQKDVKASNFTIEGLTVSNATVKQTNDKVVVLTTSAQEGNKEYTVKADGTTLGSFKGVSAVLPTAVTIENTAVQGKLGQEVIVQAKVTVADGQSKAGIPVTFYVPGNNDAVYPTITGEAVTNADGVATYSYTRYAAGTDSVTAYATGDRSKFSSGYVFWGVDTILSVEEVTVEDTINNGANKTYKITYKDSVTGKPVSGRTFNVGFAENMNVNADKAVNATVNGVEAIQLSSGTSLNAAQITTDSKGEATFTVSGSNAAVTPVVYALNTTAGESNKLYKASTLQASASKVTFAALQAAYTIEVTRDGGEVAAINSSNGRKYNVVVKDKDGNIAKNEVVNVAFNEDLDRVISTTTDARFVKVNDDGSQQYYTATKDAAGNYDKQISVRTNAKGEASFVVSSDRPNAYVTPVAWIDINTPNAVEGNLDESEPKTVAPISYFVDAFLDGASLKSYKAGKVITEFAGNESAVFRASLVNQSGKTMAGTSIKTVSYTIFNTGSTDVQVGAQVISPNRSYTVTYSTPAATDLVVQPVSDKNASVKVVATGTAINTDGKDYAFTAKEATATFTSTTSVADTYVGIITSINTDDQEVTFAGKSAVSYDGASFKENNSIISKEEFVRIAKSHANVRVSYVKDSDGKVTFTILEKGTADVGKPTISTATYTAAAAEVLENKSSAVIDLDNDPLTVTDNITITSSAAGTAGDGYTVELVDAVDGSTTNSATYSLATKTLSIELADDAGAATITANLQDVVDTINANTAVTNLTATLDATAVTTLATIDSALTAGGVNGAAAIADSSLVLNFSEAIEKNTLDAVAEITIKDTTLATQKTLGTGATFTWNAAGTALTIKLGTGANVVATDKVTASTATDAAGNVVDLTTPKAIN